MKQTNLSKLFFIDQILDHVHRLYYSTSYHSPAWYIETLSRKDKHDILEKADNDFDVNGYSKTLVQGLKDGSTQVSKHVCVYNNGKNSATILYICPRTTEYEPDWELWGLIISLLSPSADVRVIYYSNPQPRLAPESGKPVGPEHINGGLTIQCNAQEIVIYRREEDARVLIHELLHASCSDPYDKHTTDIEADTEAWTEIIYCAFMAKGKPTLFNKYMNEQMLHTCRQVNSLYHYYNVKKPTDYAWRYYNGKIPVWESLGIDITNCYNLTQINTKSPMKSLRMTYRNI
jgi:hypothetical protein